MLRKATSAWQIDPVGRREASPAKSPDYRIERLTESHRFAGCYPSRTPCYPCASQIMADECFAGMGNTDARNYQVIDRFDATQSPSDMNLLETEWTNYYAAVYRCNELLAHEGQISWTSDQTRNTYMGECRALRALCYFDMVRLWENIPLFTEPVNENRAQANPEEVYNLIFSDLKFAADNIPTGAYPKSAAASNDGHITKFAAEALLARVYLFYTLYGCRAFSGIHI